MAYVRLNHDHETYIGHTLPSKTKSKNGDVAYATDGDKVVKYIFYGEKWYESPR